MKRSFSTNSPGQGRPPALVLALGLAALLLTGCGKKQEAGGPGGPPGGPGGPMEVGVLQVAAAPVTLTQDLPGRISAFRSAEVRARVSGIVLQRLFTEGSDVTEGQVLYQIDPAPYQAALENARGTLARAEASLAGAQAKEKRYTQLVLAKVVSKQDYDDAVANQGTFQADVRSGQAAVRTAQINLGYTKVAAPITGRIGLSQVTEGAYVQDSAATLLTTIQQMDQVFVDVTQASTELLRLKRSVESGQLKVDEAGRAQVQLLLEDGTPYPEKGALQMSDVTVNPTTSSVTVRAVFPNPRGELLPGMFVRARLEEGSQPDAILIPQLAVTRNQKGEPTAMVVGANNQVELRVLKTQRTVGNQWLISEGLKSGDQVIINNLQRIRPGAPVKPVPAAGPGAPADRGAQAGS